MTTLIKILKSVLAVVVVGVFFYVFLNWPTIIKLVKQKADPTKAADQSVEQVINQLAELPANEILDAQITAQTSASSSSPVQNSLAQLKSNFKNDWLYYPRLGIEAPVDWYVEQPKINEVLAETLVHVAGTASPEEGGDDVIAGHSSYYWWSAGAYKDIFAPLIHASAGDNIVLKKNDVLYIYKVTGSSEIKGGDGFKTFQGSDLPKTLNLLTCVPIGTNLRRLIVKSDLAQAL